MTEDPRETLVRLDEIEARAEAATSGPWIKLSVGGGRDAVLVREATTANYGTDAPGEFEFAAKDTRPNVLADAAFIAAARTDVPALVALVRELLARLLAVEAERDEARANYQFMVERAADQRLDGYRELGARAAAAENRVDELRRQLEATEIARDKALAREQLLADLAASRGDDDPCCYCHCDDCSGGCQSPSLGCADIAGPFCPLSSLEYSFCPNCGRDFVGTSGAVCVENVE
jgi:hypothetical protein